MRNYLLILLTALAFSAGCQKKSVVPQTSSMNVSNENRTYTYLALGDSYTIGESVALNESYPGQLSMMLRKENITIQDTIIARTGWTTQNLQDAIKRANLHKKFDMVSLLIGVNNQYQKRTISEYKKQFRELLEEAVSLASQKKEKVFVLSIPDYGYTPFGSSDQKNISKQIDKFNAVNKSIADSAGIKYVDITPVSRLGLTEPALVAEDGLHPSGAQYRKWVDLMFNDIKQVIQK